MANEWQKFLHSNAGRGKSVKQLAQEYRRMRGGSSPSLRRKQSKAQRGVGRKRRVQRGGAWKSPEVFMEIGRWTDKDIYDLQDDDIQHLMADNPWDFPNGYGSREENIRALMRLRDKFRVKFAFSDRNLSVQQLRRLCGIVGIDCPDSIRDTRDLRELLIDAGVTYDDIAKV